MQHLSRISQIIPCCMYEKSRKDKFNLAMPYLISQGHIRSRKAIIDLAKPYSILQGQIRSRKAKFDLARPNSISQGQIRSRKAKVTIVAQNENHTLHCVSPTVNKQAYFLCQPHSQLHTTYTATTIAQCVCLMDKPCSLRTDPYR